MYQLRKRLLNGEPAIGTFVCESRNPAVAYILAQAGFDFFILDNEHGTYSPETMSDFLAVARGAGIEVVVRAPEVRKEAILHPMDAGATGVLLPMVNNQDQAREAVGHAKYPPMGDRGVVLKKMHTAFGQVNPEEYLVEANEKTLVAVQAETAESAVNADKIAAVKGVDCIFVGPGDLSVNLGIPMQMEHPKQLETVDKVFKACADNQKAAGMWVVSPESARQWIDRGARMIAYSTDSMILADGASKAIAKIKK